MVRVPFLRVPILKLPATKTRYLPNLKQSGNTVGKATLNRYALGCQCPPPGWSPATADRSDLEHPQGAGLSPQGSFCGEGAPSQAARPIWPPATLRLERRRVKVAPLVTLGGWPSAPRLCNGKTSPGPWGLEDARQPLSSHRPLVHGLPRPWVIYRLRTTCPVTPPPPGCRAGTTTRRGGQAAGKRRTPSL